MTRIKDPKQVANTIRHILLILISSLRGCFMSGRGAARSVVGGAGGIFEGVDGPVRVCPRLRGVGGTDCVPVNELNASNTERTTSGLLEGGGGGGGGAGPT
ncbi:hypothetical protein PBY51_008978 [Eleginops maclovinus]|uniref:Uncharacterized protein n=1 Tax=Eleginops maclovinus TaxID=56733 RepID=A0AAN8A2X7_ELEMC|nr:hypothetical protein PBY51_008978 [Eleginops maclovinus]